jgi:DinB superfamily
MSPSAAVRFEARILNEGYGPGAWHGPDLKAAVEDVTETTAFWRPARGRHNIAEIALHHAYFLHAVRGQISGQAVEGFVLDGEDWFTVEGEQTLAWPDVRATLDAEHRQLSALVANLETGEGTSPLSATEQFNLVLGITCHAIYHAGQIQLIKRLRAE